MDARISRDRHAPGRAEVAKIKMTIQGFFEALRRDDKVAFQRLTARSFYSFDGGKRFAGGGLLEVVRNMHARGVQLNWNIGTDSDVPGVTIRRNLGT